MTKGPTSSGDDVIYIQLIKNTSFLNMEYWNLTVPYFHQERDILHSLRSVQTNFQWYNEETISIIILKNDVLAVLGQDEGYTVKYSPPSESVPEGKRLYKLQCRFSYTAFL